jgi:hypothetical protein
MNNRDNSELIGLQADFSELQEKLGEHKDAVHSIDAKLFASHGANFKAIELTIRRTLTQIQEAMDSKEPVKPSDIRAWTNLYKPTQEAADTFIARVIQESPEENEIESSVSSSSRSGSDYDSDPDSDLASFEFEADDEFAPSSELSDEVQYDSLKEEIPTLLGKLREAGVSKDVIAANKNAFLAVTGSGGKASGYPVRDKNGFLTLIKTDIQQALAADADPHVVRVPGGPGKK